MIDPNRVTQAVMEFMQNPTWKEIFMNAPSGAMERLAISFYFSKFHDDFKPEDFDEYRALRDEYEKSMTEEDLQYLIANSDKDAAIKHYQELLDKLNQGGGQPTGQMRFEKDGDGSNEEKQQTEEKETITAEEKQTDGGEEEKVAVKEKDMNEESPKDESVESDKQGKNPDLKEDDPELANIRKFMGIK